MSFKMDTRVSKDTIARTVVLAVALINQVLAIAGKEVFAFTEEEIYQAVTICLTVASSLVAWWKNNSFTLEAKMADGFMKQLKDEKNLVGGENENITTEEEHSIYEGSAE